MTLLTLGLLGLLIVRHRKNIGRLVAGTEPKVSFRKKQEPSGRIATVAVVALVLVAAGGALAVRMTSRPVLDCGRYTLTTGSRLHTGHQRAERLAFADGGRLLIVTCPRYDRIVLAEVRDDSLQVVRDVALEGRPVAIWPVRDRLYVLERPIADARHLEAGWLEAFDFSGRPLGAKLRVGFDPDDLNISADGRRAYVLLSGHAEGETNRPDPELLVLDLTAGLADAQVIGRLVFDQPGDDPERIALTADESKAAVSLWGSNCVARIDLADRDQPRLISRANFPDQPASLLFLPGGSLIVSSGGEPGLWSIPSESAQPQPLTGPGGDLVSLGPTSGDVACTLPQGSALEVIEPQTGRSRGRLPLRGRANLADTRPLGIAYEPARGLLAVANRQGGSVHLVAVRSKPGAAQREVLSLEPGSTRK
jgi:glycerol-3-phosphate acyltransferase PlsY